MNWRFSLISFFVALPLGTSPVTAGSPLCNEDGWCLKGDMDLNRIVDVADIPGFITAIITDISDPVERCLADTNVDGDLNGLDVSHMVQVLLSPDTDNDGIPDIYETNDGVLLSPIAIGTNPFVADTDSDGIDDGDEVYCTSAGLNLRAMGASPVHKDIFIETDWVYQSGGPPDTNKLHGNQADRIVTAFANAPINNPDGSTGIQLHIDYGQNSLFTGGNAVEDPSGNNTVDLDEDILDAVEFATIKEANFALNRSGYFHYCILCSKYSIEGDYQNSSGIAELYGDDLLVSMGQWATGDHDGIGNTIMHELGHNLGLRHGGDENRNFKPNYDSVMNYWYQFCGNDINDDAIPDGALDYSRGEHTDLDENHLDEPSGITGVGPAINWNGDGDATDLNIVRNINCRLTNTFANSACTNHIKQSASCGSLGTCYDGVCTLLRDFDDWSAVQLDHLDDTSFVAPEVVHCDLSADE